MSATAVEQFGLAMIPLWFLQRLGVDLRDDERDIGSIRSAELLSITRQPALTASGARARVTVPPAAKNATSTLPKTPGFASSTVSVRPLNTTVRLADRPGRGEEPERGNREAALLEEAQQLLTDGACGADDADREGCRLVHRFVWESFNKTRTALGIKHADRVLLVSIRASTLQFRRKKAVVKSYVISTSKRPPSNVMNSLGTPRGLHEIAERIGAGQPAGMVFKSRVPTGKALFGDPPGGGRALGNLITSRILWLRGLEPGVNLGGDVDTHRRYIYIHGTQREDRIGRPMSAGCVLMRNLDIIELYDEVRAGDLVWIGD
jgi:hypothetical protein